MEPLTSTVDIVVRTSLGDRTVPSPPVRAVPWLTPPCARPDRLQPFVGAARILQISVPPSSIAAIKGACRRWQVMLAFWGIEAAHVGWEVVLAFIVARCAPPIQVELPASLGRPVAPATVATEVGALRRAAALGLEDMSKYTAPLHHPQVNIMLKQIGARVRRLHTAKRPLLLQEVAAYWEKCEAVRSKESVRDGFALVLAFFYAARVSEVLALRTEDLAVTAAPRNVATVLFRQVKNRRSTFESHEPFRVACGHPLLLRALQLFDELVEWIPHGPIFRREPGDSRTMSRAWFAAIVKEAAPGATPHSARVGCATELWASGAGVDEIMAVGRWSSAAALLYVLQPMQTQLQATDRLGTGSLTHTAAGLERWPASALDRSLLPQASVEKWHDLVSQAQCASGDDTSGDESDDE